MASILPVPMPPQMHMQGGNLKNGDLWHMLIRLTCIAVPMAMDDDSQHSHHQSALHAQAQMHLGQPLPPPPHHPHDHTQHPQHHPHPQYILSGNDSQVVGMLGLPDQHQDPTSQDDHQAHDAEDDMDVQHGNQDGMH